MIVRIPTPLRSYTGGASVVEVALPEGSSTTVADVLDGLEAAFAGIRFRVVDEQGRLRQHMMIWVAGNRCRDLDADVSCVEEVVIMQALSGG